MNWLGMRTGTGCPVMVLNMLFFAFFNIGTNGWLEKQKTARTSNMLFQSTAVPDHITVISPSFVALLQMVRSF